MGAVSAASNHSPVQLLSANWSKPPDAESSFGSDFQRLGSVATSSLGPTGKSWQTYPVRARCAEDNGGIPLGRWCGERALEGLRAGRLKADLLAPRFVRESLERWRTQFTDVIRADETFERDRASEMQRVRYGIPTGPDAFVRQFSVESVRAQLREISILTDEIGRMEAELPSMVEAVPKRMLQRNLKDLVTLRDAMRSLTMDFQGRRTNTLRMELNTLIALNDMAREAEKEMVNGGADVPLRLAVRDGSWVLKPAASTSWFASNKTRAANDSARLALLLGYPAGQPVTLKMIRDRGFGAHEYSSVLNHARSGDPQAKHSWLASRALDIDGWKTASIRPDDVQDETSHTTERRGIGSTPNPPSSTNGGRVPDDDDISVDSLDLSEEPGYASLPLMAQTSPGPLRVSLPTGAVASAAQPGRETRQRNVVEEPGPSSVRRYAAPDGSLYAMATRAEVVQREAPDAWLEQPFGMAFRGATPVDSSRTRALFEPAESTAGPSRSEHDNLHRGSGRSWPLQSSPLVSSRPPLSPVPESDSDAD